MGRIKGREAIKAYVKKYGSSGVDFLSLKNDGDIAKVRFLHEDDQDLELVLVHKVQIEEKEKWVECLEENCPFCEAYGRPQLKLFMICIDRADDKIKSWERGPTMVDFMLGFIDKYGHLNNRDYEIKRHGKKGDTKTSYQLFPDPDRDSDEEIAKLPERPPVYGRFVLQLTEEQMREHIEENKPQGRERDRTKDKSALGF